MVLGEVLLVSGLAILGTSMFLMFVLPALPVMWIRGIKFTADILIGVLKVLIVGPILVILSLLLLIAAGIIV